MLGFGLIKGLFVTLRNLFGPIFTIQYPDKRAGIFEYAKFYKPTLFTIEDTTMSKPIFQAIRAEMRRRNDFSIGFREEKPGTRMSKRDRIQGI